MSKSEDVFMRIPLSPLLDRKNLAPGMTVLLNEQSEAVLSLGYESYGGRCDDS